MKLDLSKIEPQTPTEAALLEYSNYLERKILHISDTPPTRYDFVETKECPTHCEVEKNFLRGLVMCSVDRDEFRMGYNLVLEAKPDLKNGKIFKTAVFVPEKDTVPLSKTALIMGEILKRGLREIARIYE